MTRKEKTQRERFVDAARDVGTDEDPEAFKERLKKLVKAPPPSPKSAQRATKRKSVKK